MNKPSIFTVVFKIKLGLPSWRMQLVEIITFNFLGSLKIKKHTQERKISKTGLSSLTLGVLSYVNECSQDAVLSTRTAPPPLLRKQAIVVFCLFVCFLFFFLLWFYFVAHLNLYEKPERNAWASSLMLLLEPLLPFSLVKQLISSSCYTAYVDIIRHFIRARFIYCLVFKLIANVLHQYEFHSLTSSVQTCTNSSKGEHTKKVRRDLRKGLRQWKLEPCLALLLLFLIPLQYIYIYFSF